jgi:hypothetical protein
MGRRLRSRRAVPAALALLVRFISLNGIIQRPWLH